MITIQEIILGLQLKDSSDVDQADDRGDTPLACAAEEGSTRTLSALQKQEHARAGSRDYIAGIPLVVGTEWGHFAVMAILLKRRHVNSDITAAPLV